MGDLGWIPESGRSWRKKWQPTPVFMPGESHGQRRMMGYSPCGHKESDTTERLTLSLSVPPRKLGSSKREIKTFDLKKEENIKYDHTLGNGM